MQSELLCIIDYTVESSKVRLNWIWFKSMLIILSLELNNTEINMKIIMHFGIIMEELQLITSDRDLSMYRNL